MYKTLKEFYDNVDNPLIRDGFYKELVKFYSDVSKYKFSNLIPVFDKSTLNAEQYFLKNKDNYCVYLFNMWKNNILSTNLIFYNAENEINILKEYLSMLPEVKNADDVFNFVNPVDSKIRYFIKKYGFETCKFDCWNNVNSNELLLTNDISDSQNHILTLNTKYYDTLSICRYFQSKCIKKNLPFSYSFYLGENKIDNIVIKSDVNHLIDYINIIKELEHEHPKIFERCNNPSLFAGRIDEYIGYGSLGNDDVNSFYDVRIKHMNRCIDLITFNFLKNNYKKKIKGKKNSIFLIDYLTSIITLNYIDYLKTIYKDNYSNLDIKDLNSREFFNHIAKYIKANLIKQLEKNSSFSDFTDFNVYYRNSLGRSCFNITRARIYDSIKENTIELFEANPSLYHMLKRTMIRTAKTYGIANNYCFDLKVIDDIFGQYSSNLSVTDKEKIKHL